MPTDCEISIENLRVSFRTDKGKLQAIRGINLKLQKGETLAIVGESGSGKSVTAKALLGIEAATRRVVGPQHDKRHLRDAHTLWTHSYQGAGKLVTHKSAVS